MAERDYGGEMMARYRRSRKIEKNMDTQHHASKPMVRGAGLWPDSSRPPNSNGSAAL
jgi:hypothetical protein